MHFRSSRISELSDETLRKQSSCRRSSHEVTAAIPEDRVRSMELNPNSVKEMMLNFDENKNGKIEKGEFVNFVKYVIASKVGRCFVVLNHAISATLIWSNESDGVLSNGFHEFISICHMLWLDNSKFSNVILHIFARRFDCTI